MEYVAFDLKRDMEVVLRAVQQNGDALRFADDALQNDASIVKEALLNQGLAFQHCSVECRNSRELALTAVTMDGLALYFASTALRSDMDLVLAAMKSNALALGAGAAAVRDEIGVNRPVMLEAVRNNGMVLEHARNYNDDLEIIMTAVKSDGNALQFASKEMCADRSVVQAACASYSGAFEYASPALQADPDIVMASKPVIDRYVSQAAQDEEDMFKDKTEKPKKKRNNH